MVRQKKGPNKKQSPLSDQWGFEKGPLDYLPVKKKKSKPKHIVRKILTRATEQSEQYFLGELLIGSSNNVLPEDWSTCRVEFKSIDDETGDMLILEFNNSTVVVKLLLEKAFLKDLFGCKVFVFNILKKDDDLHFQCYFVSLPLTKFYKKIGLCIQQLFEILYNIAPDYDCEDHGRTHKDPSKDDVANFYNTIQEYRKNQPDLGTDHVQHARLIPKLRPYQENAVRWMLQREKGSHIDKDELHPLYCKLTLKSGLDVYYNKYTGHVENIKPLVEKPSFGGVLADEMGLGKTVEVLACILSHSKPQNTTLDTSLASTSTATSPTVHTSPSRKRKRDPVDDNQAGPSDLVNEAKKIKVPEDWVKPSTSKKSKTYIALQLWYNNCLQDVVKKDKPNVKPTVVQCVCGSDNRKDTVKCQDCGKMQHGACLGFNAETHGDYRCPQCWINQPLIECGATLIVTPMSLRKQWCSEICKHIKGSFNVLQYTSSSTTPVYPLDLLKYDVVVTTYNVLQNELRLSENQEVISFRNQKRYSAPGSPLTRVHWWRLCLDEAQAVEAPTSMVSAMAQKLSANFRWAVTGTPISKNISDLYGLIGYLHMEPYNDETTWQNILFHPFIHGNSAPMYNFLSQVLWRTAKNDVMDQIDIPKQTVEHHWLQFSAVEQFFYKCEHQTSRNNFFDKIKNHDLDRSLQNMDKSTIKNVLAPLLTLRHVCTYPNTIRTRYLVTKKPVKSMKDLLEALISKNNSESEEYLRVVLCSLNGLAGIYLLLQSAFDAIQHYREVLQLYSRFTVEDKAEKLNVDKLQVIHTMHNLAETLEFCPHITENTLRDGQLKQDCGDVESKYIEKFINQSAAALKDCSAITETVKNLQESFIEAPGKWYSDLLDWIVIRDYSQDLFAKIDNAHSTANIHSTVDYKNERVLMYCIAIWDEQISNLREECLQIVKNLYTHCPDDEYQIIIPKELIQAATNCHLRPQKRSKAKKCPVCLVNDKLKTYELKLFSMEKRTTTFEEMSLKGSWKATTEELIFRSILAVAKAKNGNHNLVKDGETHITILDTLKKEFKEIRKLWTFLDRLVCAQDEVDMCKIRLRLKGPDEKNESASKTTNILKNLTYTVENKLETIHVLNEHELEYQRSSLHNERQLNMARLERNLGVRSYLETLHKQQYEGENPDPCPICKNTLELHYSILPCGHTYCLTCLQILIEQIRGDYIQCSICRAYHPVKDVSYIKQGESGSETDTVPLKGNYSTKVEAILKLLLLLKSKEPDVKVLIFSSWVSVLKYVKDALDQNEYKAEIAHCSNLEKQINKFKDVKAELSALLLPLNLGSKGLNLIEATHLVLIEPLLNPGDELQAIGRIHRIGQTKPTFVHKFFIKNTIEENIQKAISEKTHDWDKSRVTLGQLKDLFKGIEEPVAIEEQDAPSEQVSEHS